MKFRVARDYMMKRTVEMICYTLHPQSVSMFRAVMEGHKIPLHNNAGIDVVAFGQSRMDGDNFLMIRSFGTDEQMDSVFGDFYVSKAWSQGAKARFDSCVKHRASVIATINSGQLKALRSMTINA